MGPLLNDRLCSVNPGCRQRCSRKSPCLCVLSQVKMNNFLSAITTLLLLAVAALAAQNAQVRVAHASPDAPPVDILVNGSKAVSSLAFTNITGYLSLSAPAMYNFPAVLEGTGTKVFETVEEVKSNTPYTVAAINKVKKIQADVLQDSTKIPADEKCLVRFVHFSPDAPAVNVLSGKSTLFSNVEYKGVTKYTSLDKGKYDLAVQVSSSKKTVLALNGVEFKAGKIYSIFAEGLVADDSLQAVMAEDFVVSNTVDLQGKNLTVSLSKDEVAITFKPTGVSNNDTAGTYVYQFQGIEEIDSKGKPVAVCEFTKPKVTDPVTHKDTISSNVIVTCDKTGAVVTFQNMLYDTSDSGNYTEVTIRKDKKHTGALAISFEAGEYDNRSLYFVFPTEIGVDEDTSEEFYIDAEKQEWNVVNITYQVPTPKKKVVVDPNIGYGHSGETSSSSSSGKKKLLMWIVVAIVGGVIAAVILAAIIITVVRRQRRSSYEEI